MLCWNNALWLKIVMWLRISHHCLSTLHFVNTDKKFQNLLGKSTKLMENTDLSKKIPWESPFKCRLLLHSWEILSLLWKPGEYAFKCRLLLHSWEIQTFLKKPGEYPFKCKLLLHSWEILTFLKKPGEYPFKCRLLLHWALRGNPDLSKKAGGISL